MEHILQMETDMSIPRYAYHKPSTVSFPSKCEWQNGFKVNFKGGLALYAEGFEVTKKTDDGVCRWDSRSEH